MTLILFFLLVLGDFTYGFNRHNRMLQPSKVQKSSVLFSSTSSSLSPPLKYSLLKGFKVCCASLSTYVILSLSPPMMNVLPVLSINQALAVSGGGKDYATKDIRESDFTGQDLSNKDFTQCVATSAKFNKAILTGSRFYRANLQKADFSDATLIGTSLEDTGLEGAIFKGTNLKDAYLSVSILDAQTIENADFTDTQMPDFARKKLCERSDAKGVNPRTGTDTRESLFCE